MSDLRNKCEGYGLLNRPPMSPYLYDCWWRNKPSIILKEAKPKKEGVSSKVEASPLPAKFDICYDPWRTSQGRLAHVTNRQPNSSVCQQYC